MKHSVFTQFDIPEVIHIYRTQENYKVYHFDLKDDRCIIYFSSHGIYYPNHQKVFREKIIQKNYFEWNYKIIKSVRKIIFVRDVLKTWYLKGINAELNTIEKLLEFLRKETRGLRIICIGSSAGGYAATLFGSLLQAEKVFSFSGQFSLYPYLKNRIKRLENPVLVQFESIAEVNQYFALEKFVQENSTPIFYLFPFRSQIDREQAEYIESFSNIYPFAFSSASHGKTCYPINFLTLFNLPSSRLFDLHNQYRNKTINPFHFSLKVSGVQKTLFYLLRLSS